MRVSEVDLFVIGAGSGGVRAARIAAGYGAKVAIAEEYRVGGTCVIRGCVPKKLLVYASRFSQEFEDAAGFGWAVPQTSFDWPTLIANKDREIDRLEGAYTRNLQKAGVAIHDGRAVIEDAHTVVMPATGERFRAGHILIATGGAPFHGATIPGIEYAISSNEAFHLPQLPRRVLVQGGGYIAVEFACIFAGLGSEVTVVYRGENVLRGFDDSLRDHLRKEMEHRGIRFECCRVVSRIEKGANGYSVSLDDSEGRAIGVEVDTVMFAIGRRPNTAGLGLEGVGVETTPIGAVVVDAFSQTNVPNIYAVGDVTNRVNLTPVAIREGHAFADSVFGGKPTQVDHADVATAVFSEPELGVVGLTEAQAMETLGTVRVYETSFRPMKATLSGRETRVLMKLVVDGATDRVVGCHIAGPDAGELAQVLGIAVKMRATKADFDATVAVHPTMAEELVTMREVTRTHVRSAAAAE
ncbi:MAG: glutathione-disulfide reductase [Variibacter sp.]